MWFLALKPFIMPILLGGTLIAGGFYVKAKIDDIAKLKENNAKLVAATEQQKQVIEQKDAEMKQIVASLEEQHTMNKDLENNVKDLRAKFNKLKEDGSKRDFGELLLKKTELLERIINKGTEKVFKCFESLTRNEKNTTCDSITVN